MKTKSKIIIFLGSMQHFWLILSSWLTLALFYMSYCLVKFSPKLKLIKKIKFSNLNVGLYINPVSFHIGRFGPVHLTVRINFEP